MLKHLSLCEHIEPQCLYCEWLYCACRGAKAEQLVGKGVGLLESVSLGRQIEL